MSTTRYLQRLGHSWYVRVKVPPSLQPIIGNTHIRKSLHTRDLNEANRRKWAVVQAIKAQLNHLRGLDYYKVRAHEWRRDIRKAWEAGHNRLAEALESIAIEEAESIHKQTGDLDRAKEWLNMATTTGPTLDELVDAWLSSSQYTEQTKKQHRKSYDELRKNFSEAILSPPVLRMILQSLSLKMSLGNPTRHMLLSAES